MQHISPQLTVAHRISPPTATTGLYPLQRGGGGSSRVWEHAIWRREDTLFMLVLHSSVSLHSLPCGEREKEVTFLSQR